MIIKGKAQEQAKVKIENNIPDLGKKQVMNLTGLKHKDKYLVAKETLNLLKLNPSLENDLINNAPAGLNKFSERNRILILLQKPDATDVRSFTDWKKESCRPEGKGKAIFYLRPSEPKKAEETEGKPEEEEQINFFWVWGFDESDVIYYELDESVENDLKYNKKLEADQVKG